VLESNFVVLHKAQTELESATRKKKKKTLTLKLTQILHLFHVLPQAEKVPSPLKKSSSSVRW